ncbi:MAG: hypothetical protein M3Y70_03320 [Pseudomonadota bacterium]|nr:hypothetical protein [Pseudomonadota bacterium]
MQRGRPPANSDSAAVTARAEIEEYRVKVGLTLGQMGPPAGVTHATAARVLSHDPPTWTPGFRAIVKFINEQKNGGPGLIELTSALRGQKDAAHAAATLLRAVATLLEKP